MPARYAIGIDLGTTQSVIAYTDLNVPLAPLRGDVDPPRLELLSVPQLLAAATIGERSALPSFLYLATPEEAGSGSLELPWSRDGQRVVGEWARQRSAEVPTRTIAAAKSWLGHSRVDRHQPILPWQAPEGVPKISPVDAQRAYLEHLRTAWDAYHPEAPLGAQQVVLTVPASFDASARELTREAALAAGLPEDLVLLEEPQAAVYAWLADRGERWRDDLGEDDRLLVVDVGGGTTDFSLIGVEAEEGGLELRRLAVGDHLLVGGDNMDLSLAHLAQGELAERGVEVDAWQSVALWHACRMAKESLLAAEGPDTHSVTVLGRGSRLIGGTVSVDLDRARIGSMLVDGFFPSCRLDERPARQRGSGFLEVGLPFESDAAITRHLAHFLDRQDTRPSHVLFNGGVFKSQALRERLLTVLGSWYDAAPSPLLGDPDLDHAVARGAAYYGASKLQGGIRIRGGVARSYYVGIETAGLAVPGAPRPLKALCVVPRGMEEGTEIDVPGGGIGLVVGEPASFRFFSSTVREDDRPGQLLDRWSGEELFETDPLEAHLPSTAEGAGQVVPVSFRSRITELGVFELWCASTETDEEWKMEFSVREEG
ncbi:MAG: Hsp70 family protein [bacterium]|nr:Hsp70 family protein [bacterium]